MLHIALILCQHTIRNKKPRKEAYLQVRGSHAPHICRHEGQHHQQDEQADRQEQQQRRRWGQWRQHQWKYEQWNGEASKHEECFDAEVVRRGNLLVSNICLMLVQMPLCSIWPDQNRVPPLPGTSSSFHCTKFASVDWWVQISNTGCPRNWDGLELLWCLKDFYQIWSLCDWTSPHLLWKNCTASDEICGKKKIIKA